MFLVLGVKTWSIGIKITNSIETNRFSFLFEYSVPSEVVNRQSKNLISKRDLSFKEKFLISPSGERREEDDKLVRF